MPSYNGAYDDFGKPIIRGDDYELPFVARLPNEGASAPYDDDNTTRINLGTWGELWCTAKRLAHLSLPGDTSKLFQVTKSGGGIVVTDAAQGRFKVVLTPAITSLLPADQIYVDLQGLDDTGKVRTLATGVFTVKADVTRATS